MDTDAAGEDFGLHGKQSATPLLKFDPQVLIVACLKAPSPLRSAGAVQIGFSSSVVSFSVADRLPATRAAIRE
jgi:hypothetical protein